MALFRSSRPRCAESKKKGADERPEASVPADQAPASDKAPVMLRQHVQEMVAAEMKVLEESLNRELQNVLGRLLKADQQPASPTAQSHDDSMLPLHNRPDNRRRWTCAADGAESLSKILRRTANAEEDDNDSEDKQWSSEIPVMRRRVSQDDSEEGEPVRAVQSEVVTLRSGEHSPPSEADTHSRKSISFGSQHNEVHYDDSERPVSRVTSDAEENSMKSGSSVVWRIDALDCGDRLAASAAAKKGSASVDSIVELIESERERWAEEKLALEARLEELKEQRQVFRRSPDAEKEELKRQVQELRETMKLRSRFGAWVCERHMQESDDEEESPEHLEKEELRQVMANLESELRDARAQAAAGGT